MKMLKDLLKKFTMSFKREDILLGYRDELGIVDAQGIERYLDKTQVDMIYLFAKSELDNRVKEYFDKFENLEIIVTENFSRAMSEIEKKYPDKIIKKVDLDDFGIRPIQRDAC